VKICDYGLAMSTAKAGPSYAWVATSPYMAPEVLTRRTDYDKHVNLWSLGCVMAEMLSGEVLYKVDDDDDYMHQLDRMFDVLDAPGVDAVQMFAPSFAVSVRKQLPEQVQSQPRDTNLCGNSNKSKTRIHKGNLHYSRYLEVYKLNVFTMSSNSTKEE
jgi:cell division cycle 2-like protein